MKNKILKGFTLIELIVVIAIFSILMLGALSLIDPVSKINKSASDFEKSYAYVDNIQDYIQNSLKYAEGVRVYQGIYSDDELVERAEKFREDFYKGTVYTSNGSNTVYTKGEIRIMTLKNGSSGGQIFMNKIPYKSNEDDSFKIKSLGTSEIQLNPNFFNGNFCFNYILGSSQLKNSGSDKAMIDNLTDGQNMSKENFSIGIVVYDKDDYAELESPTAGEYPVTCKYNVATIPLLNIINVMNDPGRKSLYYVYAKDAYDNYVYEKDDLNNLKLDEHGQPIKSITVKALPPNMFSAHSSDITATPDDNIYIIYSLSDEVNIPQ